LCLIGRVHACCGVRIVQLSRVYAHTLARIALSLLFAIAPMAHAADRPQTLLILPFGFIDTSGEPGDQRTSHAVHLAAMSRYLSDQLQETGLYRTLPATDGIRACASNDQDCLLAEARKAGGDLILVGAVQKASTLISQIWVGVFDAANGKRLFYRQLSFRGDTDEAWQHASLFLFQQIKAEVPRKP
jgi:hypothetical protein